MTMVSDWDDNRVSLLTVLFGEGKSSAKIATELNVKTGTHFTRNSIIGKLDRLGLTRPREVVARQPRKSRRYTNKPQNKFGSWRNGPSLPGEPIPPPVTFTDEHKCTFFELKSNSCRWPLWEGYEAFDAKMYCGTPTADMDDHRPYCPGHSALGTNGVTVTLGLKRRQAAQ